MTSHSENSPIDASSWAQALETEMARAALKVLHILHEKGHVTYFAGGCVRDLVMARTPKDFDIATSATPDQVAALFQRTRKVGAKFGVILVRMRGFQIEVATFRTDHSYADGRRPSAITFSTPEEDAQRRDFTINGMFFDPLQNETIDHVGGRADINARLIRAIGDPARRFAEDHLRLLRAIRFAARLGFDIESHTEAAMKAHAAEIRLISPERIRLELEAVLSHESRAAGIERVCAVGLLPHLWEGASKLLPQIESAWARLRSLPANSTFEPALASLLADITVPDAVGALQSLRCSNTTIERIRWLLTHQFDFNEPARLSLANLKKLMASPSFEDLVSLHMARLKADQRPMTTLENVRRRASEIPAEKIAPTPLVTGDDLQAMGFTPGPLFRKVLEQVYDAQLNEMLATREEAMQMANSIARGRDKST